MENLEVEAMGVTDAELWLLNNGVRNDILKLREPDLSDYHISHALELYSEKFKKEIHDLYERLEGLENFIHQLAEMSRRGDEEYAIKDIFNWTMENPIQDSTK
jgi:hypothetical protein